MKKILVIVAVLAISVSSFAQTTFGVKAGANIANIKLSGMGISLDTKAKTGLIVGAFAKFNLSESFAVQPELLFAQYGAKIDLSAFGEGEITESLNYLAIPVMAKYYFGGFNVQAGPQIGILMSAKEEMDGESEDVKDDYKGADFGLNIGAGYDLDMGLGFDVRYNMGLSNIVKDTEGDESIKNNGFQIAVSYSF